MSDVPVVITTNEPKDIKFLFPNRIEIPMGFDMLLYTKRFPFPIERKAIPNDFLSSVVDGRFLREVRAMREENPDYHLTVLHGRFIYRRDGSLVNHGGTQNSRWTRRAVRNLIRTLIMVEGCIVEQAENNYELVEIIESWQEYLDTNNHLAFRTRPGLHSDWMVTPRRERVAYFYQGIPGIKSIRAMSLAERFPSPLELYSASVDQICECEGIAKKTATNIWNFLREG